jgi:hypothetical protein
MVGTRQPRGGPRYVGWGATECVLRLSNLGGASMYLSILQK